MEEDKRILKYVSQNKLWEHRKGKEMWQRLERKKLLPGRSWQSLKNRALNVLFALNEGEEENENDYSQTSLFDDSRIATTGRLFFFDKC